MTKVIDAAIYLTNKVIELSENDPKYSVDFIKTHKMLYIAQGIMLAKYNKSLFDEVIFAQEDGPWVDGLTDFYKMVGLEKIEHKIEEKNILGLTPFRIMVLNYVVLEYGHYTRDELVTTTIPPKLYTDSQIAESIIIFGTYPIIPTEQIKNCFKEKELKKFNNFFKLSNDANKKETKEITITREEYKKIKEVLININPKYKNLLNHDKVQENKELIIKIKK